MLCDSCRTRDAYMDISTSMGVWAHLCARCYKGYSALARLRGGSKLKTKLTTMATKPTTVQGVMANEWEDIILNDSNLEIKCPECGTTTALEPDASGSYTCDCNCTVLIPEGII